MLTKEEMLEHHKKWCISISPEEANNILGDEDWKSLSIGYFLALGANVETAYDLARIVTYTHHHWI